MKKWYQHIRWGLAMAVFFMSIGLASAAGAKDIMIFAPHEDDEAIACAGVIANAVARGDNVKLVLVTNGDFNGGRAKARTRLIQSMNAMNLLGMGQEDIIYFGYGDGTVLSPAFQNPGPVFLSTDKVTRETYGFDDLDISDFHGDVFGSPGQFTRQDILADFRTVLDIYRPREIFVPSPMEYHRDHAATALFFYEALIALKGTSDYSPVVYEYMIYRPGLPQRPLDPTAPVTNETADMNATPYPWDSRVTMPVPEVMMRPFACGENLKYNMLREYGNNTGGKYDRFIRAEEIFWKRDTDNLAFSAEITVSDENPATGQLGTKVADGVILGAPYKSAWLNPGSELSHHEREWATRKRLAGAWVNLAWTRPRQIDMIRLYDRPNLADRVLAGTLTFSDGSSVKVGPLPNAGSAHEIRFPEKTVTWVRFTIDRAQGKNSGLSELEVF